MNKELKIFLWLLAGFLGAYFLPVDLARFQGGVIEGLRLVKWYAREHVLLCLVPAFFIAGAISVFVGQSSVLKYLGPAANRWLSFSVASIAGAILAVCSCTVLPLFAGIYTRGAGLGPAIAFLYSGPAISVLAIILTARILGFEIGVARAVGAIGFSVIIGLIMQRLFRREERRDAPAEVPEDDQRTRPLWKTATFFASMVAVLVLANWAQTGDVRAVFLCCPGGLTTFKVEGRILERSESEIRLRDGQGQEHKIRADLVKQVTSAEPGTFQNTVHRFRWVLVAVFGAALAWMTWRWFSPGERREWVASSWGYAKQITPLLLGGVFVAGLFFGRPGAEGLIPATWVNAAVGGNSLLANSVASVVGAFMYFATLTEVPIVQGLMSSGMGQGPALALLLAGPTLSLPSMLVINSIMGPRKTLTFVGLVVVMAAITGIGHGWVVQGG